MMHWSIKLGRIADTEVRIHITFLIFLVWLGHMYYLLGGAEAAAQGPVFILALFGCVLLHEFGHVLMARYFGIPTPDITLLPIGGVARLQRIPDSLSSGSLACSVIPCSSSLRCLSTWARVRKRPWNR